MERFVDEIRMSYLRGGRPQGLVWCTDRIWVYVWTEWNALPEVP
jgi:hypothetical protein